MSLRPDYNHVNMGDYNQMWPVVIVGSCVWLAGPTSPTHWPLRVFYPMGYII